MVRLYNASCLDVLETMEENSVDLIVTDPPYLMDYKGGRGKSKEWSGKTIFNDVDNDEGRQLIRDYFKGCHKVLKEGSHIFVFCDWRRIEFFKSEFEKYFNISNIAVWNKNNHTLGNFKQHLAFKHEFILVGVKGDKTIKPLNHFMRDVLDYNKVIAKEQVHSNEKPVPLLRALIEVSSKQGDVVFDGFMGSGATGEACVQLQRDFIGVELDYNHYKNTKLRLDTIEKDYMLMSDDEIVNKTLNIKMSELDVRLKGVKDALKGLNKELKGVKYQELNLLLDDIKREIKSAEINIKLLKDEGFNLEMVKTENVVDNVTKNEIEMYDNFKAEMQELYNKSNITKTTIKEEILDGTYVWVDINENGHIIGDIQYDDYDVNIHLNKQLYECYKEDAINKLYNKIHKTA